MDDYRSDRVVVNPPAFDGSEAYPARPMADDKATADAMPLAAEPGACRGVRYGRRSAGFGGLQAAI